MLLPHLYDLTGKIIGIVGSRVKKLLPMACGLLFQHAIGGYYQYKAGEYFVSLARPKVCGKTRV